jgi:hypothetical protein
MILKTIFCQEFCLVKNYISEEHLNSHQQNFLTAILRKMDLNFITLQVKRIQNNLLWTKTKYHWVLSQTVSTLDVRTILWVILAHSSALEDSTLLGCCTVSLGKQFSIFWKTVGSTSQRRLTLLGLLDPYNPFKCQKLFTQHSITSQKTLTFRIVFLYSLVSDHFGIY